jgi:hypothetical protein
MGGVCSGPTWYPPTLLLILMSYMSTECCFLCFYGLPCTPRYCMPARHPEFVTSVLPPVVLTLHPVLLGWCAAPCVVELAAACVTDGRQSGCNDSASCVTDYVLQLVLLSLRQPVLLMCCGIRASLRQRV